MAVINSLAIGKSVKSAGNLTYKTVRGRCIASQRITQNSSNTTAQQLVRNNFKLASKIITILQSWIDLGFEKSKYGSSRNEFLKNNKLLLENTDLNTDFVNGAAKAGDWFASMCSQSVVTDGKEPYFQYFTKGSASGVIVSSVTASGWTNNNQGCSSIIFSFVTPMQASKIKLGSVMFYTGSNTVRINKPIVISSLSGFSDCEVQNGVVCTIDMSDDGQTINSINCDGFNSTDKPDDATGAVYGIPVLVINDKIVTLNKLFYSTIV